MPYVENIFLALSEEEMQYDEEHINSYFNTDKKTQSLLGMKETFIVKIIILLSFHNILKIYGDLLLSKSAQDKSDPYYH